MTPRGLSLSGTVESPDRYAAQIFISAKFRVVLVTVATLGLTIPKHCKSGGIIGGIIADRTIEKTAPIGLQALVRSLSRTKEQSRRIQSNPWMPA
jgi:hypothetical protein